jgi:hypothetical protein
MTDVMMVTQGNTALSVARAKNIAEVCNSHVITNSLTHITNSLRVVADGSHARQIVRRSFRINSHHHHHHHRARTCLLTLSNLILAVKLI